MTRIRTGNIDIGSAAIAASIAGGLLILSSASAIAADCTGEASCRQLCEQAERDLNDASSDTHWSCSLGPGVAVPSDPQDPASETHTTYECNCMEQPGGASEDDGGDDGADGGGWRDGHYTRVPPNFPGSPGYTYPPGWTFADCKQAAQEAWRETFLAMCFGPGSRLRADGDLASDLFGASREEMEERFAFGINRCDDQAQTEYDAALSYCRNRYGG